MYLRNAWYVAAWDNEVTSKPLGRILLGEPVVLYRKTDGTPVALENRCRHRRAPLSAGQVVGDLIQCGYHGMTFDSEGKCVDHPGQDGGPPECPPLRTYPVVERHRWVWLWMGDAALADPATIPDLFWQADPDWAVMGERFHVKAAYQALMDIQLDQTHSKYVHPTTLANDGAMATRPKVRRDGSSLLRCERLMPDIVPPPFYRRAREFGKTADCWINWTYCAPATVHFDAGAADLGTGMMASSEKVAIKTAHAITPESPTTSHHFWTLSRNFAVGDETVDKALSVIRETFLEDVAIVEATQAIIDLDPDAPVVDVNADTPTIQARLLVSRLIAAEQSMMNKQAS